MTIPSGGVFGEFERLSCVIDNDDLIEARFENDGDGNPIYIGYCVTPNGATDQPIWYIIKVEYVAQAVTRKRLPDNGLAFIYVWDDRSTYFS